MNDVDINSSKLPDFIVPGVGERKEEPIKIKVVGVGGGGGNAVNYMYRQNIQGVSLALCNTDPQAMFDSPVPIKVAIGDEGAGASPRRASAWPRSMRNWTVASRPSSRMRPAWYSSPPVWVEAPVRVPAR